MLRVGKWGEVVKAKQALIEIKEEDESKFKNPVERCIYIQKRMTPTVSDWQVHGFKQHPLLAPFAVKLAVLAVQSADVERVCKAHKVIHTKARNRLHTATVHMLLFTYVNLRLLNKCTAELGDFLSQTLTGHWEGDEEGDASAAAAAQALASDASLEFDDDIVNLTRA